MPLFSYSFQKKHGEKMKMILLLLLVQKEVMERAIVEGFPVCDAVWKVEPYCLPFDILKHTVDHLARKDWGLSDLIATVYTLIFSSTHWTTLLGRSEWLDCHCLHQYVNFESIKGLMLFSSPTALNMWKSCFFVCSLGLVVMDQGFLHLPLVVLG